MRQVCERGVPGATHYQFPEIRYSRPVRRSLSIPVLPFITVWVITACSAIGKTTLQGNELSACSPDLHFMNHSVICENAEQGWVGCQVNGSLENKGTAPVTNVLVTVEFGKVLNGMRSSTFNVIGDLNPGEKADFKNSFSYYLHLTDYDIKIDCDQAVRAQPSPVPTTAVSFISLGLQEEVRYTYPLAPTVIPPYPPVPGSHVYT